MTGRAPKKRSGTARPVRQPVPGEFVCACGRVLSAVVEDSPDPGRIDHVWIELDCGARWGRLTVSVNTMSRRSLLANYDEAVWVGSMEGEAGMLPLCGVRPMEAFDYHQQHAVFIRTERQECEDLLLGLARSSLRMEAWGELFRRKQIFGVHQIHSRAQSCAVSKDLGGRDGGLRFYRQAGERVVWRMLLFKFCGQ